MALTAYGVNHPLAVKAWARKLNQEALKETYIQRFMGTTSNSLIQVRNELTKGPGDRITIGLRVQLSGQGVGGDGTLEGNEEALTTYNDNILIDQLRHAVRSAGKASEQRVPFSVREEAKDGLADWYSDRLDTWFFNQICGFTAATNVLYTGMNATVAPDAAHYINARGAGNQDENITSTDVFNLKLVDFAVEKAKTLSPMIRPFKYDGNDKYVMFLHPNQVADLRTTATAGQINWYDIKRSDLAGGDRKNNGIYTGALGEYNGVVLHESVRVTNGVNSTTGNAIATVKRAVLCGAQAAVMASGQDNEDAKMKWKEQLFDYDNQLGVAVQTIAGLKKSRFNNQDFATVVVSTYGAIHS